MKQITELTEQEILALTDDQLSNMVKFKMAEIGIKILDQPETPHYISLPEKEIRGWRVKGIDNYFTAKDAAEEASEFLKANMRFMFSTECPNYDYNLNWAKSFDAMHNYSFSDWGGITETAVYKKETVSNISSIVAKNKETKAKYEADLKEYHEADNASSDIKAVIYGTYADIKEKYTRMAEMQYRYQQYVKLADGNEETAMKFLKNAYQIDDQTEYYVQGKEIPVIADEDEGYQTTANSEGCAN